MRHLLVTNDFPPKDGGIQQYLWELWRRLPADEVTVLTTPHPDAGEWDAEQDFRIVRTPERVLLPTRSLARRIDVLADEVGASLVVLDPALPVGNLGPRLGTPYAVVLHGAEVTIPGRTPLTRPALARVLAGADLVIAAGGYPADEGERAVRRGLPVVVVPPGVDTERFRPASEAERAEACARFGVEPDDELVVSISRLVPRKGMDVLVDAAALLAPRRPRLRVLIAGAGRDSDRIARRIERRGVPVEMVGRISEADKPALLGAADVFAMLCRDRWAGLEQEGFGIVFVEAAACGVPQIAGASGGAAEAVADGVSGTVVTDPTDPVAVARAIEAYLDDPEARLAAGVAARRRVVEELTYDHLAGVLADALDGLDLGLTRDDVVGGVVVPPRRSRVTTERAGRLFHERSGWYRWRHSTTLRRLGGHRGRGVTKRRNPMVDGSMVDGSFVDRSNEVGARVGAGRARRGRLVRATALLASVVVVLGLFGVAPPGGPAGATSITHPTMVRATPTSTTPHVTNGNVYSVAVVGNTVVLGGDFTTSTDPDRTPVNRSYLLAFDRTTGLIRRDWAPQLDREVYSVVAAPDGQSVYVGGRFNQVNGATQLKVARISMTDGSRMPFQHSVDAVVTTMALQGDRLFIGGVFNNVQGRQRRVAALNAQTGAVDDDMAVAFEGKHNGGDGKIWRIEPSPDGQSLAVVGSFTTVGGVRRDQVVKLDTGGDGPVAVSPWSTTEFSGRCASFTDYVRDVSFSPDSSYFVVVTTGAKGSGLDGTCDSVTRWANDAEPNAGHTWIEYSGGDSYYSVEVTGAVIYVGGHFRYSNNSYGTDSLGPGGIPTTGIASLDPANGLPLSWNPGRDRGRAVWQLVASPDGLWVASDTDRIAGGLYRGRIAFFPLAGGLPVPQPERLALPVNLEQYVPSSFGNPARTTARGFDGTTVGAPQTTVADASALSGTNAAFYAEGILYTSHSNGTMRARSFDGTTLGAATDVDLLRMSSFESDLRNMRAMAYDAGRLYYTVSGSSRLYMRYFSVESRVIGAQRFEVASSSGQVSYSSVTGMVVVGDDVYFVDSGSGQLRRSVWRGEAGGINPSGVVVVSNANANGLSWSSTELWARSGQAPNQPPTATTSASCTGLRCTFDASGSTDPDGTIAGIGWSFSDGGSDSGATVTRTFAAPGTYNATVTVTDDDGASAIAVRSVTVTDVAPVARFTSSCIDGTCTVDASTSTDVDGQVVSYAWTFGDGATGTGATASRTYAASGSYTIGLTVTDNRGQTGTASGSVTVSIPAIPPSFVATATSTPTQANAATHRVTVPAQAAAGDQLLLFASTNAPGTTTVSTPAGWTRLLDPTTSGSRHAVFARTATAADAGTTVSVGLGLTARADLTIAVYRGVVLAPDGAASATGYTTPTRSAGSGDWVVSYWADKSATTAGWTAPAGVTVRHQFAGTGSGHVSELLADTAGPVASGTVGGLLATVAAPAPNAVGVTVLLRPAPPA